MKVLFGVFGGADFKSGLRIVPKPDPVEIRKQPGRRSRCLAMFSARMKPPEPFEGVPNPIRATKSDSV